MGFKPKLSLAITQKQANRMRELIPYGYTIAIFSQLLDQVLNLIEAGGSTAIAELVSGRLGIGYTRKKEEKKDESI